MPPGKVKTNQRGGHSLCHVHLSFTNYVESLRFYLQKFREPVKGEEGLRGAFIPMDELSEELVEAFSNQLPVDSVAADGQPQNAIVYTTSYQQTFGIQQVHFSCSEEMTEGRVQRSKSLHSSEQRHQKTKTGEKMSLSILSDCNLAA